MTCRTSAPARLAPLASSMVLLLGAILAGCSGKDEPQPGKVLDEARLAGRTGASFPQADEDYFKDMDGGIALTPDEVRGRNMWLVWSGGNARFWSKMTDYTVGAFALLKIVSSHPSLGYSRTNRWNYFGLVNEPCFDKAAGPSKERRGLWLDDAARLETHPRGRKPQRKPVAARPPPRDHALHKALRIARGKHCRQLLPCFVAALLPGNRASFARLIFAFGIVIAEPKGRRHVPDRRLLAPDPRDLLSVGAIAELIGRDRHRQVVGSTADG